MNNQDFGKVYQSDWEHLQSQIHSQCFPQTFLLQTTMDVTQGLNFADQLATSLLCLSKSTPCGECRSCQLRRQGEHPDLFTLSPEKIDSVIKIDQIRNMQSFAYLSPQLSNKRIILIQPAEKLNTASANALLKLLEEPPSHLYCVLIAQTTHGLPATLLSRCQHWQLSPAVTEANFYEALFHTYPSEHPRAKLLQESTNLLKGLCQLREQGSSAFELANKWDKYALSDIIWLLYLLQTATIGSQWLYQETADAASELELPVSWRPYLKQLTTSFTSFILFQQLDAIRRIQKHLMQHIHFNQQLVLESLFLMYM
ncbi:MAG: hypothetical protein H2069_06565 [Legionella sp.]|nr:hypothetical protein [Legionella sp.]